MPNKTQQMISGLLEAYKRKRRWKVLTIILSVVVLCNTFYAMQNAAVAVTDQTAEEVSLDPAASGTGTPDLSTIPVTSSGDPTIEDLLSQTPADPAATDPEAPTPPAQDPALQDPAVQDPSTTDPALQGDPSGTLGGGTITDEIIETTDEDPLTTGGETDPSGTAVLGQTRQAAGATTRAANVPENITSAIPVSLSVTDENNRLVNTVRTGDTLYVDLAWQINDMSEIDAAGDFIYIKLPEGFSYPSNKGYFSLQEDVNTTSGYLYYGTTVAEFDFVSFAGEQELSDGTRLSAGKYLRITHALAAVWLNKDGKLASGLKLGERKWMQLHFPVTVTATDADSPLLPSISTNGRTVYNNQGNGYNGYLAVEADTVDQITSVTLGTFKIKGYAEGIESYTYSGRPTYVESDANAAISLEIPWSWSTQQGITDGDYFELRLPDALEYRTYGPRVNVDTQGNVITDEIYFDTARNAYYFRNTYADVSSYGYNQSSGVLTVNGYVKNPDGLNYNSSGKVTLTLQVSVDGSSSAKTGKVTVVKASGSGQPGGGRYYNRGYDYQQNYNPVSYSGTLELWVLSESLDGNLSPEPFNNRSHVDYKPGASTYVSAYCFDPAAGNPGGGSLYTRFSAENYKYDLESGVSYNEREMSFSQTQLSQLKGIMSAAYPYVSLAEMSQAVGVSNLTEREAVTAVYYAIWRVKYGNNYTFSSNVTNRIRTAANALLARQAPSGSTTSYDFAQEPVFTVNQTTATVTGTITPAAGASSLTGVFRTSDGRRSVNVSVDVYGRFSATLTQINAEDTFDLVFEGTGVSSVQVWCYVLVGNDDEDMDQQDLISAEVTGGKIRLERHFEQQQTVKRKVRVIKRWTDENGNELATTPTADVTLSLYRSVNGGQREHVKDIVLTAPSYTWEEELPLTDANGNVYHYSVLEKNIPDGYTFVGSVKSSDDNGQTLVLTATNREEEEETTRVRVEKRWGENVTNPDAFAVRVQLFAKIDGQEIPVWIDKSPMTNYTLTEIDGTEVRTLNGNYAFSNEGGYYHEVIVYLNPREGWSYLFDKLPLTYNGKDITYVVREISIGYNGQGANSWQVNSKDGGWYAGAFEVVYTRGPEADKNETLPTVVVTNDLPDTKITVVKEWPEAGIPANIKIVSAHVILYRVTEVNGQQQLQEVYVKVDRTTKSATGDIVIGSDYKFGTKPGADYGVAAWTLTKDNGWKVTFEGLPMYEEDDGKTPIRYVFKEDEYTVIENGTQRTYKTDGTEHLFTVTHGDVLTTPDGLTQTITNSYDYTNVIVTKAWEGLSEAQKQNYRVVVGLFKLNPSGRGGLGTKWPVRIETAGKTETLTQAGLVISGNYFILDQSPAGYEEVRAELTADNNWTVRFEDLPRYDEDGKTPVQYLVRELAVYDKDGNEVTGSFNLRYAQYTQVMGDGKTYAWAMEDQESGGDACVDITNTITSGTITVKKEWLNYDGTGWFWAKPAYIEVKLTAKRKGVEIPDGTDVLKGVTQVVQLMENNGWSHTWKDILEDKDVTYFVEEVTVVYVKNGQEIRIPADEYTGFTGPDGPVEVKKKAGGGFEITGLENRREVTELIIIKEDETNQTRLNGAEFALYRVNKETFAEEEYIATFTTGTDTSLPAGYQEGVVRVDGKDHEGLLFGYTYKLVETKAPAGYREPENNNAPYIIFTMNGSGTPYDPTDDWIEVLDRNKNNDAVFETANDKTLGIRWLRVENRPRGYVLPEAGGIGTKAYTTGGISLMIATLLMYSTWKFMRKNEKGGRKNQ